MLINESYFNKWIFSAMEKSVFFYAGEKKKSLLLTKSELVVAHPLSTGSTF